MNILGFEEKDEDIEEEEEESEEFYKEPRVYPVKKKTFSIALSTVICSTPCSSKISSVSRKIAKKETATTSLNPHMYTDLLSDTIEKSA